VSSQDKIVVIEDDPDISELIQFNLTKQGFKVSCYDSGKKGFQGIEESKPDLVVLDVMLPEMDGISVLRKLKENPSTRKIPVLMLTAKNEESDILIGLELGADDYIPKPFSVKELTARVRAVLRRVGEGERNTVVSPRLEVGPLSMDVERHELYLNGSPLVFTLAEFRILQCLISKPGRVFTREELISTMTGGEVSLVDRNVDVHIRSIRKKLDKYADMIITIRGIGYKCKN
jgi:DNA-binding response OmpR family regulator